MADNDKIMHIGVLCVLLAVIREIEHLLDESCDGDQW